MFKGKEGKIEGNADEKKEKAAETTEAAEAVMAAIVGALIMMK